MVFDGVRPGATDEDDVFDAGIHRLLHQMLYDRLVSDGQHFFGHGFRRGQEPCTVPGHGNDGLPDSQV
jgi:hypothetical protein